MFKDLFVHLIAMWLYSHLNKNFPFCTEHLLNEITRILFVVGTR